MKCTAIASRTGERCGRDVRPGDRYCRYHRERLFPRPSEAAEDSAEPEHAPLFDQEEFSQLSGVDEEVAMLRRRIREAELQGDPESFRRLVETLLKALRVQRTLANKPGDGLSASLARVLEEVGSQLTPDP